MNTLNEAQGALKKMQDGFAQIKELQKQFPHLANLYAYDSLLDSMEIYIDDLEISISDFLDAVRENDGISECHNDLAALLNGNDGKEIIAQINSVPDWLNMSKKDILKHNEENYGYE